MSFQCPLLHPSVSRSPRRERPSQWWPPLAPLLCRNDFQQLIFCICPTILLPLVLCWCTQSVNHACQPRGCRRAAHQSGCTRQHSWASAAVRGACKLMEHGSAQACPPVAMCRRAAWGGGGQGPPSAAPEEAPALSLVLDAGKAMQNPSNLWAPRGCIGSRTVLEARTGRRPCPVDCQYCCYRCERPDRSLTSGRPLS